MRLAVPATATTVLVAGALIPEPPPALQVLVAMAMLGALGAAGDRLARWLCPDFGLLSRVVAAFSFAIAVAVAPATWMGHFGVMRPAPFLIWTAAALLLSRLLPVPKRQPVSPTATPSEADRWTHIANIEWALVLAALATVALFGLKYAFHYRWAPVGLGPDDESYHLAAMAVWHRFGDLRMIKFAIGDTSTTFYPVGSEVWSWVLLAPFRDSDVLARWAQLPFAVASLVATAAIGRRLGLPLRSALMAALLFAAIRRVFPVLAFTAGNDHSTGFFTLAAIDAALALVAQPAAGVAIYAGAALGLLLGTKYIGLLFAPTILAVLLLAGLGRRWTSEPGERLPVRTLAGLAVLVAVAGALAGGYTYLRNWVTAGNPIFPAPLSLFGHSIFPGWPGADLKSRQQGPEFQIDVWKFLLDRRDLLGSLFPYTMLPAAFAAPLLALWRRRGEWWRDALVLLLPVIFFLEFLYLMGDHRDMRYFLPGVALSAVAFAWLVEQAGPRIAAPIRVLVLLVLTFHVARKLDFGGTVGAVVALALIGLGWLAVRYGPPWGLRLALTLARPAPRRWLAVGAAAIVLLAALPLAAAVTRYQAEKLLQRPPALALERMAGPSGAAVAYVGLNKPYTFFGSRLQNDVRIVPRKGELEDQYYEWGGTLDFPYEGDDYVRWRRRLDALDVDFVVVHRSPWEDPERDWMEGRPRAFRLEFFDTATEIWRVVSPQEIWRQRKRRDREEDSSAPEPGAAGTAPTPGSGSGPSSSGR
ncbi:MAG TPA: hypothetical protein VGS07_22565 [Thermoanaerobaculia bacterium]|jgi:hypothetical protein|nr:hypothetical protein [Thermoanaerobaculia bacterium]